MENYEQKYKEALERARDLHDNHPLGQPQTWMTCEKIFPELRESEDEKIRKAMIKYFEDIEQVPTVNGFGRNEFLAWLEKQAEQKPADSYCQENCKGFKETGKCFADGDCKAKRDAEQNHIWSEEDENNRKLINDAIWDYIREDGITQGEAGKLIQWLQDKSRNVCL